MSGNVAEWTSQQSGTIGGKRIFILRGGSFNNYEPALRCDSSLLAFAEDYSFLDAGFRCCSSARPGRPNARALRRPRLQQRHCGGLRQECTGGTTCTNGVCQ